MKLLHFAFRPKMDKMGKRTISKEQIGTRADVTRWLGRHKNGTDMWHAKRNETRNGSDGRDYLFCTATAIRGDIFRETLGQTVWKTRKNYIGEK